MGQDHNAITMGTGEVLERSVDEARSFLGPLLSHYFRVVGRPPVGVVDTPCLNLTKCINHSRIFPPCIRGDPLSPRPAYPFLSELSE
jgi:hypothetical protein